MSFLLDSPALDGVDSGHLLACYRHLTAVVVAIIGEDGRLVDCNAGFRRLRATQSDAGSTSVANFFVTPRFDQLVATLGEHGQPIHRGVINFGEVDGAFRSLVGNVYRDGAQLVVVAEYDVAELESLNTQALQLNDKLLEMQRQLARNERRLRASMQEAEAAKQAAEAVNLSKSRFLATMSREIHTPLNGVLGMAQLVLFPELDDDVPKDANDSDARAHAGESPPPAAPARAARKATRTRVLIVDDISENIAVVARALADDHDIQFALSGAQALALISADPPDLVLLEVMMTGMDGLETLRRIKELPVGNDIPVILVTADGRTATQLAGFELGAVDFLGKPVELPVLRARTQNVLEQQRLRRELLHLATTDSLTQVANRRYFLERAAIELARIKRYGSPAGLLMVDLDRFKQVNDCYGHAAGDAVLRYFAAFARERLRVMDAIGRLGGEEFAILLPDTTLDGAMAFARQLCDRAAASAVATAQGEVHFSISIGVAAISPIDDTIDQILARADAALYAAKKSGRNRVTLATAESVLAKKVPVIAESPTASVPEPLETPVLAIDDALERLGGDLALFMIALSPLPEQIASDRAIIAAVLRTGDGAGLRRAAHRLKGALGLAGANRAVAACQALEAAARAGEAATWAEKQRALEGELEILLVELSALLKAPERVLVNT